MRLDHSPTWLGMWLVFIGAGSDIPPFFFDHATTTASNLI